jgi:hypothetical protein
VSSPIHSRPPAAERHILAQIGCRTNDCHVPWTVTDDIAAFSDAAGDFLSRSPVDHCVLLTEAAYLRAIRSRAPVPAGGAGRRRTWSAPTSRHRVTLPCSPGDLVDKLERLGALHTQGVLSDAEFALAKASLLSQ